MCARKIFICAGEASGDMHAAALMAALRRRLAPEEVVFRGFGGDAMSREGAELLYHTDQTSVIGITPVLAHLPFFAGMFRRLKREILVWKPDLVLTVDYPGMNLRLDAFARQNGVKTVHYVCPQVWAWHRGRIPKLAKIMDTLLCILPFEPALFRGTGLDARFIGHPLVDRAIETRAKPRRELPWGDARYRVALLPGSRRGEILRILPRLLQAAVLLQKKTGNHCAFIVPAASRVMRQLIERTRDEQAPEIQRLPVAVVDGGAREVMLQAHVAAVASGTATLEACLMRCPTVLVYAVGPLTAVAGRLLIRGVKWLGLANIIAGRTVMPELIQQDFTPERLSDVLKDYLIDPEKRDAAFRDLDETNAKLGPGGASNAAAGILAELLASV